jgi:hypothetical protein
MRRMILIVPGLILLAGLLTGCGGDTAVVVPTVAELPTVTPTTIPADTATPLPTDAPEPFFTPTPVEGEQDSTESGLPSPTPDTLDDASAPVVDSGPCGADALATALADLDQAALADSHTAFMADLREAAAALDDWVLAGNPDPLSGSGATDVLPRASLRYRRGDTQEAFMLVSPAPDSVRDWLVDCLADEGYFRAGDVSAEAAISIEPLALGDSATLTTITEATDAELGRQRDRRADHAGLFRAGGGNADRVHQHPRAG